MSVDDVVNVDVDLLYCVIQSEVVSDGGVRIPDGGCHPRMTRGQIELRREFRAVF
jgi:hypothetical protein